MTGLNVLEIVTLSNRSDYVVADKIEYNGNTYILFIDIKDSMNMIIQREVIIDNQVSLEKVENEETLEQILIRFHEKMEE